jgi:hypothetical protein
MSTTAHPANRTSSFPLGSIAAAIAADVASVLLFVVLGRRTHESGTGVLDLLETAAPFLLALAVGWLAVGPTCWRRPLWWRTGVLLFGATFVIGMVLRRFVFDRGTALSFMIVAGLFLVLFLVGWRLVVHAVQRRRHRAVPHPAG